MKTRRAKSVVFIMVTAFLAVCCICRSEFIPSQANSEIDTRKNQQKDISSQIGDIESEIKEITLESAEMERDMEELESVKEQSEMTYNELLELLAVYEEELNAVNAAIDESEELFYEQETLLKARIRHMYMNSNSSALDALTDSNNLLSFLEKIELYSSISRHDRDIMESYKSALYDLEFKRGIQLSMEQDTQAEARVWQMELNELESDRAALELRILQARADIDWLQRREDELEKKSKQLEKEIKDLTAKSSAAAYNGGSMKWPVPGYNSISSRFGNRMHPVYKVMKLHTGIDIGAPRGVNIVAAKGGTVISAGWQGGYGNTVIIDHGGGITTLYGHCSKLLVQKGDKVKEGAAIAKVGSTGVSTGNHLHFEVRKSGTPVNPVPNYLSR